MIGYIEGAGVCMVKMEFKEVNDTINFEIANTEPGSDKKPFVTTVPLPNLFKAISK